MKWGNECLEVGGENWILHSGTGWTLCCAGQGDYRSLGEASNACDSCLGRGKMNSETRKWIHDYSDVEIKEECSIHFSRWLLAEVWKWPWHVTSESPAVMPGSGQPAITKNCIRFIFFKNGIDRDPTCNHTRRRGHSTITEVLKT